MFSAAKSVKTLKHSSVARRNECLPREYRKATEVSTFRYMEAENARLCGATLPQVDVLKEENAKIPKGKESLLVRRYGSVQFKWCLRSRESAYAVHPVSQEWSPRAFLHVVGMLWFMSKTRTNRACPLLFISILVSIYIFMALSTVFLSVKSPDNSPLSHAVLPVLILPCWSIQLYISLRKSPSALI